MTPGPTPAPPEVLAAIAAAGHPPPRPRLPRALRAVLGAPAARSSAPSGRCCSSAAPAPARWSRPSRTSARPATAVLVVSAGYFGERWAAIAKALRRRRRPPPLRVGRDPVGGRPRRAAARARGARPSSSRTPRPRPASSPTSQAFAAAAARGRRARRRRRGLEPRRGAARDRRVGHRRRRLRLAEGADDPARASPWRPSRAAAWERAARADLAALLLRLGARRARRQATLDAPFTPAVSLVAGARRRARDAARRGPRGRLRAPRPPRPRLPRGRSRRWASSCSRPTTTAPPS